MVCSNTIIYIVVSEKVLQNCAKKQFDILCHKGVLLCMHGHIYIQILRSLVYQFQQLYIQNMKYTNV